MHVLRLNFNLENLFWFFDFGRETEARTDFLTPVTLANSLLANDSRNKIYFLLAGDYLILIGLLIPSRLCCSNLLMCEKLDEVDFYIGLWILVGLPGTITWLDYDMPEHLLFRSFQILGIMFCNSVVYRGYCFVKLSNMWLDLQGFFFLFYFFFLEKKNKQNKDLLICALCLVWCCRTMSWYRKLKKHLKMRWTSPTRMDGKWRSKRPKAMLFTVNSSGVIIKSSGSL